MGMCDCMCVCEDCVDNGFDEEVDALEVTEEDSDSFYDED